MIRWFLPALFISACATTPTKPEPLIPEQRRPEVVTKLPDDPEKMAPPSNLEQGEWVESIEVGTKAARAGIIISETRAWRDAQYRLAYKALRDLDLTDRNVWTTHRSYYEERVAAATQEIEKLQPTWWDRNGPMILIGVSFLIGAGVTVGLTKVIAEVNAGLSHVD